MSLITSYDASNWNTRSAKRDTPMPVIRATCFLSEILLVGAASVLAAAEAAVKYETASPDQLIISWCLIGGFLGAFCSIRFFPVSGKVDTGMQLAVNLILSATFSPALIDITSYYTKIPAGLRMALPISVAVGIVGQALVSMLIPRGKEFVNKYLNRLDPPDKP